MLFRALVLSPTNKGRTDICLPARLSGSLLDWLPAVAPAAALAAALVPVPGLDGAAALAAVLVTQ